MNFSRIGLLVTLVLSGGLSYTYLFPDTLTSIREHIHTNTFARESSENLFENEGFIWLQENGLTRAKDITEFRPNDTITRGEAAKFLTNFSKLLELEQSDEECNFSDISGYDTSLVPYIGEACRYGIFRGSNGKFLPKNQITEAQALAVIGRSLYGIQDEKTSPWYNEYYLIGQEIGLIGSESLKSVDVTNITREKLGNWLYIASKSDKTGSDGEDPIIYETPVDGPDDCTSYEVYESKRKVCSFECKSELECKNIQSQIESELDGWGDDLAGQDRDAPESGGESTSTNTKVLYTVSKGEKIAKVSGIDTTEYQKLWKEVADLSPDTLSDTYIENFEIYEDASSDIIAYVSDDDGNGKWKMSINLPTHKLSDTKEQKITLIHELSHIITLNKDQFMNANGKCPNYETVEGCTRSSAYLNSFVKKYWGTAKTASYDANKFVTEYASSNPEEDIAESFAFFVVGSDFSDATIKDQKIKFFSSYPELMKIREGMRNVLASEIIRARKIQK